MSARPNSLAARGSQATLHGFSDPAALLGEGALPLTRGHGVFVEDESGRRYLDAMVGLWCAALGFSGPLPSAWPRRPGGSSPRSPSSAPSTDAPTPPSSSSASA